MLYVLLEALRTHLQDWNVYWLVMVLDRPSFRALAAASLAFFLVVLAGRPVIAWLRRKKIGDAGLSDSDALRLAAQSKASTPTMGGILICGAITISTLLLADIRNFYVVLGLVVLAWLSALGGMDDWLKLTAASRPGGSRQGLYAWEKLVFQLGLGALVGYFVFNKGDTPELTQIHANLNHVLNLPFQATYVAKAGAWNLNSSLVYLPMSVFIVLTLLMVTGMSNAVNIADGMDGLAAGMTVVVSIGLLVLTYIAGWETAAQYLLVPAIPEAMELTVLIAAIAGACLGFLWWNCSPAQVFMGDTGSLALGGLLAYCAVVVRQEVLLLIMCGVFLLEIFSVVMQVGWFKYTRITTGTGKRLFKVAPIHHHFHILGWTEQQVVARFWIITALLVVLALALVKVR